MDKRYKLRFFGSVQGVGFRYTAKHLADMYRLTGYVKNEYDGSVTSEVQGRENDIDAFVHGLRNGRFIDITSIEKTAIPTDEYERAFHIR